MAERAVGAITSVTDRSWPRDNSAVWEITASTRRYFIKRHPSPRFHDREVTAYRQVVPSLGQGRAPEVIAADRDAMAVLITGLPGHMLQGLSLPAATEVEAYRQAGRLLRHVHDVPIATDSEHRAGGRKV
jgi:aminoglycoside/choline kinase family phosphotransferase